MIWAPHIRKNANTTTDGHDYANTMTTSPAPTSGHTYTYAYDNEGNQISRTEKNGSGVTLDVVDYTWDFRNRLTEVQSYSVSGTVSTLTQTVNYGYDAFDHRVRTTIRNASNVVTLDERFVYDGSNLVTVVDGATLNTMQVYLQAGVGQGGQNQVLAEDTVSGGTPTTRWAMTDYQGTVRDVLDSDGNPLDHIVYSSFGHIVSQSDSTNAIRIGYAGMVYDTETGLNDDGARYYYAYDGRFMSQDPTGFAAGDTDLYRYVGNSPMDGTDPTGLYDLGQNGLFTALFGTYIQRIIMWTYDAAHPVDFLEDKIWNNQAMSTIWNRLPVAAPLNRARPDIVHLMGPATTNGKTCGTFNIYEIKPAAGAYKSYDIFTGDPDTHIHESGADWAQDDARYYGKMFAAQGFKWALGPASAPGTEGKINIGAVTISWDSPAAGAILYRVDTNTKEREIVIRNLREITRSRDLVFGGDGELRPLDADRGQRKFWRRVSALFSICGNFWALHFWRCNPSTRIYN